MSKEIDELYRFGAGVQSLCFEAARLAYDDAAMSGICEEGRIELALDAIRSLDISKLVRDHINGLGRRAP